MKVLKLNQEILTALWILPVPDYETKWIKLRNTAISFTFFLLEFTMVISSVCFIYEYINVDVELSLYALLQLSAQSSQVYMLLFGIARRHKLAEVYSNIQQIYDERKPLRKLLEEAEQRASFITTIATKYLVLGWIPSCSLLGFISFFYSIIKFGFIDRDLLYVPYKLILPWDQRTTFGWILESLYSVCAVVVYLESVASILAAFIGICVYQQAFTKYIRSQLNRLSNEKDRIKQKEILIDIIQFHNSAKEIFLQSADVFSVFILIFMICHMTILTTSLFQLDLAIKHFDFGFFIMLITVFVSGLNLFMYCYYGHLAHEAYMDLSDRYFYANWLNLPSELQKYFIILTANAQRPIYYHGFGVAYLHFNTFLKMIRTVISYFMSLKTLTAKY